MLPWSANASNIGRMQIARTLNELRAATATLRQHHGSLAMVPTMGALHAGHQALVHAAVASGAAVVTSIFVNPTQFAAGEDLSRYPRDEPGDLRTLEGCGCHLAWLPDVETMYPPGNATMIEVAGPAEGWEGAARPGHFRGVATVCARLFGQARPDAAYFGEKDWQQVQVVTRMVADLLLPLRIVPIPTVREPDGLAMSSRNRFLSPAERAAAPRLHAQLQATAVALANGEPAAPALARAVAALDRHGFAVDYFALVDGPSLQSILQPRPGSRLITTARIGSVRLLDNISAV
jgi:pantoate--beta-alanine ligase